MNKILYYIAFLLGFPTLLHGQLSDFKSWHEVELQKDLTKNIGLLLGQELRLTDNSSYLGDYITTLGVSYKFNKYLRAKLCYRYNYGLDIETDYETTHRIYGDLTGRYKLDRFIFSVRERYQVSFGNYTDKVLAYNPVHYLRSKVSVSYNINKSDFNPYVSAEFFYSLNNPMGNTTDKYRLAMGFDYDFTKQFSAGLYYQTQVQRISYRKPTNDYILGTSFSYKF
jgi:hypothetical protein